MRKPPRTYATGVSVSLGLATTTGRLIPLRTSESVTGFHTLCPGCPDPTRVRQVYSCKENHGPFLPSECTTKGKYVDDTLVALSAQEIEALKELGTSSEKSLTLRVHPAEQVDRQTLPTGIAYRFESISRGTDQFYGVLYDVVAAKPNLAFIGTLVLRGREKIFRLTASPHALVMTELCRPEEMHVFEKADTTYEPRYLAMATALADAEVRDFDPIEYHDSTIDRLAELLANKKIDTPKPKAKPQVDPLEVQLAAALAAAKAAKRTVKRPRRVSKPTAKRPARKTQAA